MRFRLPNSTALALVVRWPPVGVVERRGQGALPSLIPVKGKVTYKGQPLTTGTVRFEPDGYGRMASGKLQSDGTYVLSTLKEADGVVAGTHRVFITDLDKKLANDRAFKKYTQAEQLQTHGRGQTRTHRVQLRLEMTSEPPSDRVSIHQRQATNASRETNER